MASNPKRKLTPTWKALIEVSFIIFLFYSNLLMGEFTRANGRGKSLAFALEDIFSVANFGIAIVSGVLGYLGFELMAGTCPVMRLTRMYGRKNLAIG
jgi:hypothetical protein